MSDDIPFPGNYATSEAAMFWDVDECKIDDNSNAVETSQKMKEFISRMGHNGPVSIRGYGDKKDHDFDSAGVKFTHFPAEKKYEKETKILEDLVSWAAETREPSTFVMILGEVTSRDFVEVIRLLSQKDHRFIHVGNNNETPRPRPRPPPTMVILFTRPGGN